SRRGGRAGAMTVTGSAAGLGRPAAVPQEARPSRLVGVARRTLGLRTFLSTPIGRDAALRAMCERLEQREASFLDSMRRLVYGVAGSPYRPLLDAAGCSYADVEASVRRDGIEATLERLRDAGVYVTLEEWKGREPIVRGSVELHARPVDFENPFHAAVVAAASSGSSGAAVAVQYGWGALSDRASEFRLVYEAHGAGEATTGVWYPAPPGAAGLLTVLHMAKLGLTPERWFSQTPPRGTRFERLALRGLLAGARLAARPLPAPRHTGLADAGLVARWFAAGRAPRLMHTFASSAVRLAHAAQELGLDLSGRTLVMGGEPLTQERRDFLRSLGLRPVPYYIASDCGMIGSSCAQAPEVEDYHFHAGRLALVPAATPRDGGLTTLLLTSLRSASAKVLLNVDVGDEAVLERRTCDCLLGRLGLDVHLSQVQSRAKQTSEGMTVPSRVLWELAGAALAAAGATRDDYQIWEIRLREGVSRVALAVAPHVEIDERALVERVLGELARRDAGGALAADV